jgi:hypothetical protein
MDGVGQRLRYEESSIRACKATVRSILAHKKRGKLPTIPLVCGIQSAYMRVVNRRKSPLRLSDFFSTEMRSGPIGNKM